MKTFKIVMIIIKKILQRNTRKMIMEIFLAWLMLICCTIYCCGQEEIAPPTSTIQEEDNVNNIQNLSFDIK